jgi:hypothetical protein
MSKKKKKEKKMTHQDGYTPRFDPAAGLVTR